ncbi:M12 family metallo-peptidase [Massilia sp. 9096]|uniref:M12 family metallo-peptidase n=1 Tax=Massilia sp. 9096 TaxID=1500894 RepID=UPI000691CE90|nr:M12 family metallo-peptidase [Massilia sp. 9096]
MRTKLSSLTLAGLCLALAAATPAAQAQTAAAPAASQAAAPFWQSVTLPEPAAAAATSAAGTTTRTLAAQSLAAGVKSPALQLKRLRAASLDLAGMRAFTADAPRERIGASIAREPGTLSIALPHPDGGFQRFLLVESPIMEPGLAAAHPEIKTYKGVGVDDPAATVRMDITPLGLHASVRSPNGGYYVDPYYRNDTTTYASYARTDLVNVHGALREGAVDDPQVSLARSFYGPGDAIDVRASGFAPGAAITVEVRAESDGATVQTVGATADQDGNVAVTLAAGSVGEGSYDVTASDGAKGSTTAFQVLDASLVANNTSTGTQLRTYRVALVSDPSYASYFGANNVTAAKVTLMNRVTQVYESETSIRLVLIDATDKLNLATSAAMTGANGPCGGSACFTAAQAATCGSSTLSRNRVVAGLLAGAGNFDIGHIALGLDGGGIASLGVVGANSKAQGCTGIPTPVGDFYAVDYVAHEMGHQFGGNHTFNGTQANCSTSNRNAGTSVEPGSGSSVMAYAGICGTDDLQTHSDPYWSQRSFDEITAYTSGAETSIAEVQMGVLTGFSTNGQSFQLSYNGSLSAPIVRGSNYTAAGIAAAIQAIPGWPAGGTVSVTSVSDTAFTVTYGGTLANVKTSLLQLLNCASCSGYVGEIAAGGPTTRHGTVTGTGNSAPVVTTPAGYTIPVRTPFVLTGGALDPDGEALAYMWEQNDRGATGTSNGTGLVSNVKTNGPLFRQFGTRAVVSSTATLQYGSPGENHTTADSSRTFPDMAQILANNTNAETGVCPTASSTPTAAQIDCFSEYLPTAAYVGAAGVNASPASLNFRLTARDGHGGVGSANTQLVLAPGAGPFLVTSPNTAVTLDSGSAQTVTWSVANTNVAPVSTANVRITLSTDGGQTWPIVLAESVPNNGSASVVLPAVASSSARIMVAAVGNVFFDVSNANFTIRLVGDLDGDGQVGCADLGIVKAAFGKRSGQAGYDARADYNKDGAIDVRDLTYETQHMPKGMSCN